MPNFLMKLQQDHMGYSVAAARPATSADLATYRFIRRCGICSTEIHRSDQVMECHQCHRLTHTTCLVEQPSCTQYSCCECKNNTPQQMQQLLKALQLTVVTWGMKYEPEDVIGMSGTTQVVEQLDFLLAKHNSTQPQDMITSPSQLTLDQVQSVNVARD